MKKLEEDKFMQRLREIGTTCHEFGTNQDLNGLHRYIQQFNTKAADVNEHQMVLLNTRGLEDHHMFKSTLASIRRIQKAKLKELKNEN